MFYLYFIEKKLGVKDLRSISINVTDTYSEFV